MFSRLPMRAKPLLPARETFGIAIDRRAAMVDHEDLILELVRQARDVLRLERIHQELEEKSMRAQMPEALPPRRIVENAGLRPALGRIGMPTDDLADTDDAAVPGECLERGRCPGRFER